MNYNEQLDLLDMAGATKFDILEIIRDRIEDFRSASGGSC